MKKAIVIWRILHMDYYLYQYFSKYESDELKVRLKEIKKNPQNKQLADMINYVSDVTTTALACMVMTSN